MLMTVDESYFEADAPMRSAPAEPRTPRTPPRRRPLGERDMNAEAPPSTAKSTAKTTQRRAAAPTTDARPVSPKATPAAKLGMAWLSTAAWILLPGFDGSSSARVAGQPAA